MFLCFLRNQACSLINKPNNNNRISYQINKVFKPVSIHHINRQLFEPVHLSILRKRLQSNRSLPPPPAIFQNPNPSPNQQPSKANKMVSRQPTSSKPHLPPPSAAENTDPQKFSSSSSSSSEPNSIVERCPKCNKVLVKDQNWSDDEDFCEDCLGKESARKVASGQYGLDFTERATVVNKYRKMPDGCRGYGG